MPTAIIVQKQEELCKVRKQIQTLREQHGDCLNTWPVDARCAYEALSREKRALEIAIEANEKLSREGDRIVARAMSSLPEEVLGSGPMRKYLGMNDGR